MKAQGRTRARADNTAMRQIGFDQRPIDGAALGEQPLRRTGLVGCAWLGSRNRQRNDSIQKMPRLGKRVLGAWRLGRPSDRIEEMAGLVGGGLTPPGRA